MSIIKILPDKPNFYITLINIIYSLKLGKQREYKDIYHNDLNNYSIYIVLWLHRKQ